MVAKGPHRPTHAFCKQITTISVIEKLVYRHSYFSQQGVVCLDILKDKWSPAFTVSKVLLSVIALLSDCNPGKEIHFQFL